MLELPLLSFDVVGCGVVDIFIVVMHGAIFYDVAYCCVRISSLVPITGMRCAV